MNILNCFLLTFFLASCHPPKMTNRSEAISSTKKLSYLALGDSYTIGESVRQNERFPSQLVARLQKSGLDFENPTIIAQTGWTTDELISAIKNEGLTENFDLVTLLIGVNNQYRHYSKESYRKEFKQLLKSAVDFAGKKRQHVLVISIPDWGVTPYADGENRQKIAADIDTFNRIAHEETEKMAVTWVDITPVSRQAATEKNLVAQDGLHPSAEMYTLWVDALAPIITAENLNHNP